MATFNIVSQLRKENEMLKEENKRFLEAFPHNMREWLGKLVGQVTRFEEIANRMEALIEQPGKKPKPLVEKAQEISRAEMTRAEKRKQDAAEIEQRVLDSKYPLLAVSMSTYRGASAHHIINRMAERGFIRRRVTRSFHEDGTHTDLAHGGVCWGTLEQWKRHYEADLKLAEKGE